MTRKFQQRGFDYRLKADAISAARKVNPKKYKVKVVDLGAFYGIFTRRKR